MYGPTPVASKNLLYQGGCYPHPKINRMINPHPHPIIHMYMPPFTILPVTTPPLPPCSHRTHECL